MKKIYEGEVTHDRVSDTGKPSFAYAYCIGGETVSSIDDKLRYYK